MSNFEKLSYSPFVMWEMKVEFTHVILVFCMLDNHIRDSAYLPLADPYSVFSVWGTCVRRADIGLTFADEHLEHVRDREKAGCVWSSVTNLFQR